MKAKRRASQAERYDLSYKSVAERGRAAYDFDTHQIEKESQ